MQMGGTSPPGEEPQLSPSGAVATPQALATRLPVSPVFHAAVPEDEACEPPEKEAGVLWDAMCLTFLLIQRRIFLSYYHLYVVADLDAAKALASRYQETQEKDTRCQGLD